MKPVYNKKKEISGYEIGSDDFIKIHRYYGDDDNWYLTARRIDILSVPICGLTSSPQQILKYAKIAIEGKAEVVDRHLMAINIELKDSL